jgi:hypothetical protein
MARPSETNGFTAKKKLELLLSMALCDILDSLELTLEESNLNL